MIEKNIDYFYGDGNSTILELIHPASMEKTAQMSDDLSQYISELPEDKSCTYVLCNALSSGEYYGSNRNGDYFPEEVLKKYHKTFEALGYVYRLHQNKDPLKSIGKVVFSHYNDNMHRVELVLKLDNKLAKDEIEKLKKGEKPATSMGAKVPFDQCSICGNKAKTRGEYCSHLKTQMNQILPDGRKVYCINTMPKFFDLSIVFIPADKTSSLLRVVGGENKVQNSTLEKTASLTGMEKIAEITQLAEINKRIVGEPSKVLIAKNPEQLSNILALTKNKIKKDTIEKLAEFPLNEILSTFNILRIMPTPEDFQKVALYSLGEKELADNLELNGVVFEETHDYKDIDDVSPDLYNEKIASILEDEVSNLSLTKDLFIARGLCKIAQMLPDGSKANTSTSFEHVVPYTEGHSFSEYPLQSSRQPSYLEKLVFGSEAEPRKSPVKNPIIPLSILGILYGSYAKIYNKFFSDSKFLNFIAKHPEVIPAGVLAGSFGSTYLQNREFNKTAGFMGNTLRNAFITIPTSYYFAGKNENKARRGEEISVIENIVRKHPLLVSIAAAALGSKLEQGIRKMANFVAQIPEDKKDIILKDLIGG